ncbi:carbohydrate-binding protein [Chloroflexota bacterium]
MKAWKIIGPIIIVVMLLGLLLGTACGSEGPAGVGIYSILNNGDGTFTLFMTDGSTFTTDDMTGPQGAAGGSMAWQGVWISATSYSVDDAVENDGSSYICIQEHTSFAGNEPGVGGSWETYWDLFAQAGADGADGDTGPEEPNGEPGPNMIVAMGYIDASGSYSEDDVYNVDSCTVNDTEYEITLTDIDYYQEGFVTIIQPTGTIVRTATYYNVGTDTLIVHIYNSYGNPIKNSFSFMVLETPQE